ncbi:MAG TPA: trigger factor, partial [Bacillota bacterium]|nr:trigger factor [Bacillota bacterium]
MQFNLEKLDKNLVSVEATVSVEEIEEAIAQAYKKVVKKINLPGFRKGNIPRHILEAQFGKEVFYEDALDIIVPKAYLEALTEFKLEPIDHPKFDVVEPLDASKPFVFKATVELLPEVKLGEYKNLQVEKNQVNVSEEDVDKQLKVLQERHSELVLSEKDTLEKGDFAIIDFEGYIDGKPFAGGAAQAYSLEIGSGTFIPGFEDQLIGMKNG